MPDHEIPEEGGFLITVCYGVDLLQWVLHPDDE
jgi:hypothetical protein